MTEVEGKSVHRGGARAGAASAGIELPEPPRSREAEERARAAESERARMVRLQRAGRRASFAQQLDVARR